MGHKRNMVHTSTLGVPVALALAIWTLVPTMGLAQTAGPVLARFGVDQQALSQVDTAALAVNCRSDGGGTRCEGRYPTALVNVCQAATVTAGLDRRTVLARQGEAEPHVTVRLECRAGVIVLFRSIGGRAVLATSDAQGHSTQRQIPL